MSSGANPLSGFNMQSTCCICQLLFVGLLFAGGESMALPCHHAAHVSCVFKAAAEKNYGPCKWYIELKYFGFINK